MLWTAAVFECVTHHESPGASFVLISRVARELQIYPHPFLVLMFFCCSIIAIKQQKQALRKIIIVGNET